VDAVVLFLLQMGFQLSRVTGTRFTADNRKWPSVFMTLVIQLIWLLGTALGVKAVLDGDIVLVFAYIIGGMVGTYLAHEFNVGYGGGRSE
jgi:hypothetical protein